MSTTFTVISSISIHLFINSLMARMVIYKPFHLSDCHPICQVHLGSECVLVQWLLVHRPKMTFLIYLCTEMVTELKTRTESLCALKIC